MKRISFILISLTFWLFLYGQTNTNDPLKAPEYIPPSPEAAAFAKYGDIPVGEYTGTPNIDIPIYTVKSGSLSLPISLNYHATGIQVSQEATWVGLGWNLIAGGCINYVPIGGNEQLNSGAVTWTDREKLLNSVSGDFAQSHEDHFMNWGTTNEGQADDSVFTVTQVALNSGLLKMGEPDVFSVNFLNYSFKFFLYPKNDSIIFLGKKNKCKIAKSGNGLANGFVITGEDGVQYTFGAYEIDSNLRSYQAWYLTSIISPDGHYIKLMYKHGYIFSLPTLNERDPFNYPEPWQGGIKRTLNASTDINNLYLSSIVTETDSIIFNSDNSRKDLAGSSTQKLRAIKVFDKISNKENQRDSLNYDYFRSSTIGGDYTNDDSFWGNTRLATDSTPNIRLKLTKLTRYDINATKGEVYSFTYNDSIQLPMKTSFARDYWGFYNGQENSSNIMPNNARHTLIPDFFDLNLQDSTGFIAQYQYQQYTGANRGASANYIGAEMIKSIQYPTGGKTVFAFEPHTFSNQKYLSAEDRKNSITHQSHSVFILNNSLANDTSSFTLNQPTIVSFSANINGNGANGQTYTRDQLLGAQIMVIGPFGRNSVMRVYSLANITAATFVQKGNTYSWTDTLHLAAGNYILNCSLPTSLGNPGYTELISAVIQYDAINTTLIANAQPIGGGLRVKTITNYNESNNVILTKRYIYNGGKMLSPLTNVEIKNMTNYDADFRSASTITFSSDSYSLPASAYIGNNVGYDQVKIQSISGSNTDGTDIINFQNNPASFLFFNIPQFSYCTNGDILGRIYLNAANDTVHSEKNTYAISDLYNERINYFIEDTYLGPINIFPKEYMPRFIIVIYSNKNFWDYLSNKEETDYFGTNKVNKTTNYTYNPTNYCVSQTAETRSDGHIKRTVLKYPNDFPKTVCDSLTYLHILNPVIVDSTYVDSKFLEWVKTNYISQHGGFYQPQYGGVLKPYSIENQIGNNASKIRIQYAKYDSHYNPVYVIQNEAINEVYLWSYNYQYPVVKIEGLTYAQVTNIFPQTSMDILASTPNPTADMLNNIRSAFAGQTALITTYTYQPLIGISTATAPNGVVTTYKYDTFNRLWYVNDNDGNNILNNQYHYGNH